MYYERLKEAERLSGEWGLVTPTITPPSEHQLCDGELFRQIAPYLTITKPQELVAKCNIVSQVIVEVIESVLQHRAYLTIGDIHMNGKPFFGCDRTHLQQAKAKGTRSLTPSMYHHHAWITLESMEIIDFTFNTSLAMLADDLSPQTRRELVGGILSGHADRLKGGIEYRPVLVGDAYYREYDCGYEELANLYRSQLRASCGNGATRFVRK